ncbi:spore germination protein KC [Melghirimyces thermohalophilus]|uniref:Spore germination protein KC n=1 Tax=Melghirimyces thermohalophilus TaxID=1236220 RepID=A0A1G6KPE2_9BACL|nr:Ger(x)C family spore germination protein [Melghirimyces thermohalophilus]SDC32920.1 spore germination protein KC [Melghirimyces thermohalophilus]
MIKGRVGWVFLLLILLCGCADRQDIDTLAFVSGVAIDRMPDDEEYQVTFQIINPAQISTQTGKGGSGRKSTVTSYTGRGSSLSEALQEAQSKSPRKLFFAHRQIWVIGERVARQGIQNLIDITSRLQGGRLSMSIAVAKEAMASDVLDVLTAMEQIPAFKLHRTLEEKAKQTGMVIRTELDDVIHGLVDEGVEPVISGVEILGQAKKGETEENVTQTKPTAVVKADGMALFRQGRLRTWVAGKEARGVNFIKDRIENTLIQLPCQKNEDAIGIQITQSKAKIRPSLNKGQPMFTIQVDTEGKIIEANCQVNLEENTEIRRLEKKTSDEIEKQIRTAIGSAQKVRADVFGFGQTLHRKHPKEWTRMKQRWPQLFKKAQVQVQVKTEIENTGLRTQPLLELTR